MRNSKASITVLDMVFTIESLDFNHDVYDDVGLHYVLRQVPSTMMFTIMWGGGDFMEQVVLEYAYHNAISSISGVADLFIVASYL